MCNKYHLKFIDTSMLGIPLTNVDLVPDGISANGIIHIPKLPGEITCILTYYPKYLNEHFIEHEDVYLNIEELCKYYMAARSSLQITIVDLEAEGYISDHELHAILLKKSDDWFANVICTEAGVLPHKEAIIFLKGILFNGFNHPLVTKCLDITCELLSIRMYYDCQARRIQRKFRNAISNPYHPMCNRRLMWEFNNMLLTFTRYV